MDNKVHYGTVSEAINKLREQGFTIDFNLGENCIVCDDRKFNPNDFHIVDVYRYEGATDPADEAAVYAIESHSGLKGLLVAGYGPSSDSMSNELLQQLNRK